MTTILLTVVVVELLVVDALLHADLRRERKRNHRCDIPYRQGIDTWTCPRCGRHWNRTPPETDLPPPHIAVYMPRGESWTSCP